MKPTFGHFDDPAREYVVTDPLTPLPWINYLGNTRLTAFVSQQAGGLVFHKEPLTRRISRYHYLPAAQDQPGFYLYVKDHGTGSLWNPHFGPTSAALGSYECRHGLGYTRFIASRDGVEVSLRLFIPPGDDVMLWDVSATNRSKEVKKLTLSSYLEFGLLEFAREAFWCYLKNQIGFTYDATANWIQYDYHVFQAPYTPAVFFSCTRKVDGFDTSRAAFCGRGGSLERPQALVGDGFTSSQIPAGGHGCGAMGVDLVLAPGATERFAYMLGVADDWRQAADLKTKFSSIPAVDSAFASLQREWERKTSLFQAETADADVNRFVNVWNPLNCQVTLERTRDISTDHMGLDGMRYRDTMQDALAMANIDPEFAKERIRLIFAAQGRDGSGCFSFYPYAPKQRINEEPRRSDNTVWPIMTVANLVNETGDLSFFEERIPFRDGGEASIYEHILIGLEYIHARRGPHGLPLLAHADWNDGLAVFHDENAESVMLGMQLVHAAKLFREFAARLDRCRDVDWCDAVIAELDECLNAEPVWDGEWYCRLLLSNGMRIGSRTRPQGKIYLEPQVWSVISGIGRDGRGRMAMDAAHKLLNTRRGLMIHTPPYTGIPNPEDPLTSNVPGTGENGSIFCHAMTWAIIAECLLCNGDRAFEYYRKLLPSVAANEEGHEHWGREPYVFASSVIGPAQAADFGRGGISWLTGTASWAYIAATQYLLGIRPTFDGLEVKPCLPSHWTGAKVSRRFRGKTYRIELNNAKGEVFIEPKPKAE
jgi:cellobiose phosphorylase